MYLTCLCLLKNIMICVFMTIMIHVPLLTLWFLFFILSLSFPFLSPFHCLPSITLIHHSWSSTDQFLYPLYFSQTLFLNLMLFQNKTKISQNYSKKKKSTRQGIEKNVESGHPEDVFSVRTLRNITLEHLKLLEMLYCY